ncbi:hypothetical protein D3C78_1343990 [compost metagenome]
MAAKVSPPPAMENAALSAIAWASTLVPLPNWSNSNTPTGPFHRMVFDDFSSSAKLAAVCGPMSRIMSSAATSAMALTVASALSANSLATTTSTGSGTLTLAAMALAVSTRSGSYSDLPTGWPAAARKVLAMPPPTINWSQTELRLFSTSSLVETLEPATMAAIGLAGAFRALPRASSSAASSGPAAATLANLATPWVEPSAR